MGRKSMIRKRSIFGRDPQARSPTFQCPPSHQLLVTTRSNVFQWTGQHPQILFSSGAGGIVKSTPILDEENLLAIADSLVVVLHNVGRGMNQTYRLKRPDGRLRLLEYIESSRRLYFTTSLLNSVQSYSLDLRTVESSHSHPSPPTCIAFSQYNKYMISSSARPPTILLQDHQDRSPPISILPSVSTSAVIVAKFHPTKEDIFLLGFSDSSLATYNVSRLLKDGDRARKGLKARQGGEIGNLKLNQLNRLISLESNRRKASSANENNSGTKVSSTIVDAAFIPGSHTRVVCVTSEGRCLVIEFDSMIRQGSVIRSWLIDATGTSVSVLDQSSHATANQSEVRVAQKTPQRAIIAIGREDGNVDFYDEDSDFLGQQSFELSKSSSSGNGERAGNTSILGLEWTRIRTEESIARTEAPRQSSETLGNIAGNIPVVLPQSLAEARGKVQSHLPEKKSDPKDANSANGARQTVNTSRRMTRSSLSNRASEDTIRRTVVVDKNGLKPTLGQNGDNDDNPYTSKYTDLFSPVKPNTRSKRSRNDVAEKENEVQSEKALALPQSKKRKLRVDAGSTESESSKAQSAVSAPLLWEEKTSKISIPPPDQISQALKTLPGIPNLQEGRHREESTSWGADWLAEVSGDGILLSRLRSNSAQKKVVRESHKTVSFATAEASPVEEEPMLQTQQPPKIVLSRPASDTDSKYSTQSQTLNDPHQPTHDPPPVPPLDTSTGALRRELRDLALDTRRALLAQKIAFETALESERATNKRLRADVAALKRRVDMLETRAAGERGELFSHSRHEWRAI